MHSFVSEIETVLSSTQETDLLGLKRVLQERHPGEYAYDRGFAQEVLHQLLEDLTEAFTGDGRLSGWLSSSAGGLGIARGLPGGIRIGVSSI